jgi:polyisoprenoid-binding protein YceI
MFKSFLTVMLLLLVSYSLFAQEFKIKAGGSQIFNFEDKLGRNQATFFSLAPLEDFTGTANGISGTASFDIKNFAKTLKGKIRVKVASINTGIELRNHHLRSADWLDEPKYPEIVFEIKSVSDVKQIADNKLEFKITGNITLHGITKEVSSSAEATYLDESEQTRNRAPGDLLGVHAKFYIHLSDFNINNDVVGSKVADNIEVRVNIVGSNK